MSVVTSGALFEKLDGEFRKTSAILFGGDVGGLHDFEPYLSEYMHSPRAFPSSLSGKDVYASGLSYLPSSRFASFDELDWKRKFEPLDINEIKDMDSIVQALGERFYYAGNVVLGKSRDVGKSANVTDSFFVYESSFISNGEYVACSSFSRNCKHLFGTHDTGNLSFAIRTINSGGPKGGSRFFESFLITGSSDIFYSHSLDGCQKCWFSFFQRGKKYLMGNLQLSQPEYAKIEQHLREQIRDDLESKRRTYGLFDVLRAPKSALPRMKPVPAAGCDPAQARKEVEKAWRSTSAVLLGRELRGIDAYGKWLTGNVDFYDISVERSPASGEDVYVVKKYWALENLPPVFVGTEKEQLAALTVEKRDLSGNLASMVRSAGRIAYLSLYYSENCANLDAPIVCANATNGYKTVMTVLTKNSGYSFWPRESTNIFGSSCVFAGSACINTHYSQNVARTFEADSVHNSSDIYFCHNVEGLSNCMFCFNAKSTRNSIGNAEYGKEDYMKLKKSLLEQIAGELESKKTLRWSIYNIGAHEAEK